jgi:hypothetical protein
MVQHIELFGRLFAVDLRSPMEPAKRWFEGRWVSAALTNEEVLFNPGAEAWQRRPDRVPHLGRVAAA